MCFKFFKKILKKEIEAKDQYYFSDNPITDVNDDCLGREKFATRMAQLINDLEKDKNYVISINGKWGSGKTSTINMIKNKLKSNSNNFNLTVDYSPWNVHNEDGIINQFFDTISSLFLVKKIKKVIESAVFNSINNIFENIPNVGRLFKKIKTLLVKYCESYTEGEKNIETRKELVCKELKKLPFKIIVFIDDLDRLNKQEIRLVMQLVKSVCNFPNVIYVLAFDDDVVVNALNGEQDEDGSAYLEKIVQFSIDLPKINKINIMKYLDNNLKNSLKDYVISESDKERIREAYISGFADYFTDLRRVNRYINVVNFKKKTYLKEINIADFLILEAISLFDHETLKLIYANKKSYVKMIIILLNKEQWI